MSHIAAAVAEVRKALVAVVTLAAAVVATGLIHGDALVYTQLAINFAGMVGVYAVPNAKSDLEQRIADLEHVVPGLPALTQQLGDTIATAIAEAWARIFGSAPPSADPPVPAVTVTTTTQDPEVVAQVARQLRDNRGRFIRRT